jgi:hypothetical protein
VGAARLGQKRALVRIVARRIFLTHDGMARVARREIEKTIAKSLEVSTKAKDSPTAVFLSIGIPHSFWFSTIRNPASSLIPPSFGVAGN